VPLRQPKTPRAFRNAGAVRRPLGVSDGLVGEDGDAITDGLGVDEARYFLTAKAMAWFWDAYQPDVERRSEPFASPLRASDEQLAELPPAFAIVDEADVLRDEGEAYAARLRAAEVDVTTVRYDGIHHDFMMLNPLSGTHATRAAIAQAISFLRPALGTE
jgi:acetyl esterase